MEFLTSKNISIRIKGMANIIPEDLLYSLLKRRIHLFVGSGVSCAAKLIGWHDLINEMKKVIRNESTKYSPKDLEEFLAQADHLEVAEVFRQTVRDHRYFSFLRTHFRCDVTPSQLHRELSFLPVKTVFTTNFDKLLEISFRGKKRNDPPVIIYPDQLGCIDDSEIKIIKLHGDIDHPKTIVLTRSDYARYAKRHKDFEFKLHISINDYTLLLVGFGIRDQNFRRIYYDARTLYDSTKRLAYAIMTGTNSVERRLWEEDGLKIIPVKNYNSIPKLIHHIRELALGGLK